jgi:cell wall-associated NlpC family hydrolase
VHRTTVLSVAVLSPALLSPISRAFAQSDITISPFVSFLPTAGASPLAGLALTLGGNGGLGLRASGHMALDNSNNAFANPGSIRPWGADADAVLNFGSHGFTPFVFAGLGIKSADSLGTRTTHHNWSYGFGGTLPISSAIGVFGEGRWRMSSYVLPTSNLAPASTREIRVGVSFRVGGSSSSSSGRRYPRERRLDLSQTATFAPRAHVSASPSRPLGTLVVGTANQYVGVPFRLGGTSPRSGFDGPGFVQYVFDRHGVMLPSSLSELAEAGQSLPADWHSLSAGDLVFFERDDSIYDVAIYAGRNRIIHSSAAGGVRYEDLSSNLGKWYADHMVVARRVP